MSRTFGICPPHLRRALSELFGFRYALLSVRLGDGNGKGIILTRGLPDP